MSVRPSLAATLIAAALFACPAADAEVGDVERLQQQIDRWRADYEARIQALEARVQSLQRQLEALPTDGSARGAASATATASGTAPPPVGTGLGAPAAVSAGPSAFNPAISLILAGTYANLSRDPADYRIQGFIPSGGEVGPGTRGFSLGESELGIAANIDPTFSGRFTASITAENEIAVEEALFEHQGLFEGATLSGGRFLSSIGYLNSQHAHAWDFVDAPLAYQAFLGGQRRTDGLRLTWVAPTDRYLALGAEIGAGNAFPGASGGRNGIGSGALFAHLGDDLGASASWRIGASYLIDSAHDRTYVDRNASGEEVVNAFDGHSRTWVLDAIYKWAPGGNATRTNLKVQGEYFRRTESGTLTYDTGATAGGTSGDYRSTASGWYLQTVYQFMPQWRAGLRYDRLDSGTPTIGVVDSGAIAAADLPILAPARPSRTTVMVDYSLSEFSRFRLQIAADRSQPSVTDRQLFLQYIMSLGAHGAHTF